MIGRQGKQYMAGSVPASGPEFNLKAGSTSRVLQDTALRLSRLANDGGTPLHPTRINALSKCNRFTKLKKRSPSRSGVKLDRPPEPTESNEAIDKVAAWRSETQDRASS